MRVNTVGHPWNSWRGRAFYNCDHCGQRFCGRLFEKRGDHQFCSRKCTCAHMRALKQERRTVEESS